MDRNKFSENMGGRVNLYYRDPRYGEALIAAIKKVVPEGKQDKLDELGSQELAADLANAISTFNTRLLVEAGFNGFRGNPYGRVRHIKSGDYLDEGLPEGLHTLYNPDDICEHLERKLVMLGVLPIPQVEMIEIVASLGLPLAEEPDDSLIGSVADEAAEVIPHTRVVRNDRELGAVISGDKNIDASVKRIEDYIDSHREELDEMIRELWQMNHMLYNRFLFDEERGERANLYKEIGEALKEGARHFIDISDRSRVFRGKALYVLLSRKGFTFKIKD